MDVIDLFSGIGGFSLGLERAGMNTVAFCEIDPFCQKILKKHWPDVPIHEDVREFEYDGTAELICGGYPCQPFSVAGNKRGKDDDRHLWPAMFSIIQKYKPNWVIGENVAGHIGLGLDDVLSDLESEEYEARAFVIPACAVNAPHRRDRVWIVANASTERRNNRGDNRKGRQVLHNENGDAEEDKQERQGRERGTSETGQAAADNSTERVQRLLAEKIRGLETFSWCKDVRRIEDYFNRPDLPKPLVCGGSDGVPDRVDRTRALGNAVVPIIPEIIGTAIMEIENEKKEILA